MRLWLLVLASVMVLAAVGYAFVARSSDAVRAPTAPPYGGAAPTPPVAEPPPVVTYE